MNFYDALTAVNARTKIMVKFKAFSSTLKDPCRPETEGKAPEKFFKNYASGLLRATLSELGVWQLEVL